MRRRAGLPSNCEPARIEYVAQEQVALSTAPVWDNGCLNSRSVVLRTYVLNTGDGWIAIPGGLVRVAEAEGSVVSMQRGGHSKDAWVLSDSAVDTFSLLRPRHEPVELHRVSRVVPSSVADNVFWLGRYVERAENIARILRAMIPRVRRAGESELVCLMRLHRCLESRHSKLPKPKHRRPTSARTRAGNDIAGGGSQAARQSGLHAGRGVPHRRQRTRALVGRHDVPDRPAAGLDSDGAARVSGVSGDADRLFGDCFLHFPEWSGRTSTADWAGCS